MSDLLTKPVYVDIGYRTYELVVLRGPLQDAEGDETWCRIIHDQQRIELSDATPLDDRLRIVAEAVSRCWRAQAGGG